MRPLLELFAQILVDTQVTRCIDLIEGIPVKWDAPFDVVNPYGDRRGTAYESVWLFDLGQDTLFLTKSDSSYLICFHHKTPLSIDRARRLTLEDFSLFDPTPSPRPAASTECPAPYWKPEITYSHRDGAYLGRLLQDFGHTWRHLLRRQQNRATFLRLAHAVVWIATLDFTVTERTVTDRSPGGPYAWVTDLPEWNCPDSTNFKRGSSWFVLSETLSDGLQAIQHQVAGSKSTVATDTCPYLVLILRHVIIVRCQPDGCLEWTKPEVLYDGGSSPTQRSIDLMLLASRINRPRTSLSLLPMEIQDRILQFTSYSSVAPVKLGCYLGIGPAFQRRDRKAPLVQELCKRKRLDTSPVEFQVLFGAFMSYISYKPQLHMLVQTVPPAPTRFPPGMAHLAGG